MIKLLNDVPVLLEISPNELADRLDPESYYATYLHSKGVKVKTEKLSKLVNIYKKHTTPKSKDVDFTYVDYVDIDSNYGTVSPKIVYSKKIPGSRKVFHGGNILFSRMRPYLRRIGIIPETATEGICSTEFYVLEPNRNTRPHYLMMVLRSKYCITQANKTTGSSRPRLLEDSFGNIDVPMFADETKDKIEQVTKKAIALLNDARGAINNIKNSYDEKLEQLLPMSKLKTSAMISAGDLEYRCDPEFYTVRNWIRNFPKSKVVLEPLEKLAVFSDKTSSPKEFPDKPFKYIEITDVNNAVGQIDSYEDSIGRQAKGRARRLIEEGNVIVSTTRPHRGAIAIVPEYHHNDIASTGFQVLISNNKDTNEYLSVMLRTRFCLTQLWGRSTGSGYPEISRPELKQVLVPMFSEPDPVSISKKIRQYLDDCQTAKLTLKEIENAIEKRLSDEIADSDLSHLCETLEYNLDHKSTGTKYVPVVAASVSNKEPSMTDYF